MNENIEMILMDWIKNKSCILVFFQEENSYKVNICDQELHNLEQYDISDWEDLLSLEGILLAFDFQYQIKVGYKVAKSGIQCTSNLVKMKNLNGMYTLESIHNEATRPNLLESLRFNNDIILEHFKVKNNDLVR